MIHPELQPRRRLWPVFVAPGLFFLLAAAWSVFWFIAASRVETRIDEWRAREAKSGRIYDCARQTVGGYPFRLEVRCMDARVTLTGSQAATVALGDLVVVAQVYDLSLLVAEAKGPLDAALPNSTAPLRAHWALAQSSVRGRPQEPQRVSIVFDKLVVDSAPGVPTSANGSPAMAANHLELHGRIVDGTARDHPVIEVATSVQGGSAQLFAVTAKPFDGEAVAVLYGLQDFGPKSWPDRFREIAAANGRINLTRARVVQGEFLGVGAGEVSITPQGLLNGELQLTLAGADKIIPALGLDKMLQGGVSQTDIDKVAPGVNAGQANNAIGALDKLVPGLGRIVSRNANASLMLGLNLIGQPAMLEGRNAIAVPLKFRDGAVFLGPLQVGRVPAVF